MQVLLFILLTITTAVYAEKPGKPAKEPSMGFELTFTSPPQQESEEHGESGNFPYSTENEEAMINVYNKAQELMQGRKDISSIRYYPEGSKWTDDYFRVKYKDGFYFDVTMDPACLEVIPKPMTISEVKKYKDRIQKDIFDLMKEAGLTPHRAFGGGHIHLGALSAFGNDVKLFRNFIVDMANHTELASGALENDPDNATPLYKLKASQRKTLKKLIERSDQGEFKTPMDLATAFVEDVLFEGKEAGAKKLMAQRYLQLNVMRMADLDLSNIDPHGTWAGYEAYVNFAEITDRSSTLETRHLRAQMNAQEVVWDAEMVMGRLNWLKKQGKIRLSEEFMAGKTPKPKDAANSFVQYLKEAGVNPKNYVRNIPQPGDEVRGWKDWRKAFHKKLGTCDMLFQKTIK